MTAVTITGAMSANSAITGRAARETYLVSHQQAAARKGAVAASKMAVRFPDMTITKTANPSTATTGMPRCRAITASRTAAPKMP